MSKKSELEKLRPHELKVLHNEFLKEELIQKRLTEIIEYKIRERQLKTIKMLSEDGVIENIMDQLKNAGLTVEQAKKMSTEEFKEFCDKNKIEI